MGTQMVYDYDELAALTKAAQDGDVRAYGRIRVDSQFGRGGRRVIVHNPEDAEDIAQETFAPLVSSRSTGRRVAAGVAPAHC